MRSSFRGFCSAAACIGLLVSGVLASADAAVPSGAAFLTISPSARVASLGDGGSALVSGASSLGLNPAGFGSATGSEFQASHTDLFGESAFDSVSYLSSLSGGSRALGAGAVYLRSGTIEGRADDRSTTGSFSASDLAVALSYGQRLGPSVSAGATVKLLQQRLGDASASGVALDLGLQLPVGLNGLSLGLAITNLGPSMKFITDRYALPTAGQIGLGYRLGAWNLVADAALPVQGDQRRFSLGTEFSPFGAVVIRGSYLASVDHAKGDTGSALGQFNKFAGISAGLGLRLGRYQVDYALVPHEALGETQQISFSGKF